MTTTNEEMQLLKSFQALRVVDYERYQELLKAVTKWIEIEVSQSQPTAKKAEKVVDFKDLRGSRCSR